MNTLSPELHFPKPPFRIDRTCTEQPAPVLADYLGEIRSWRLRVLEFLAQPGGAADPKNKGLTERAKMALVTFLAGHWASGMAAYAAQSPYNISPFPTNAVEALASPTMEPVLEVLRWQAGVNDYLGDVCFVMGEPALELDECMALGEFSQAHMT